MTTKTLIQNRDEAQSLVFFFKYYIATLQPHFFIRSFKHQPHKMVKHTQTIRRLLPTNCLNVFDHFVGLALKGLSNL